MSSSARTGLLGLALLLALVAIVRLANRPAAPKPPPVNPPAEVIPPGIIVTESSSFVPPPPPSGSKAPGDNALIEYGKSGTPQNDLEILSNTLTNFLTVNKQTTNRPLSANEEWSASLRGKRPGTEAWISEQHPILDSEKRLIDRWGTPLHFHALGGQKWEIRSAGPDKKVWTEDDLLENLPRGSGSR